MSCVAKQPAAAGGAPRVLVAGATGFAGALAAHLLWRHPRLRARRRHRALGASGRRLADSTRATACRL